MRWLPILALTAACGTTTTHRYGPEAAQRVVEALRTTESGQTVLVAGERAYFIEQEALRDEIGAFRRLLADEAAGSANDDPEWAAYGRAGDGVLALAYPGHQLDLETGHGRVTVQRMRVLRGTQYWIALAADDRGLFWALVGGTPELDSAWRAVERAAERAAGSRTAGTMQGHYVFLPDARPILRAVGVEFRGPLEEPAGSGGDTDARLRDDGPTHREAAR